ncbi:MAG: thiopeptide-type bacteriocin biosynthesis protein, partial [Myxococcaceae bacterium]
LPLYSFLCLLQEDGFHTEVRTEAPRDPAPDHRWVCLSESEGDLTIDLRNPEHAALSTEGPRVEQFPQLEELAATGPEGHYAHELIVPYVRRTQRPPRSRPIPKLTAPPEPRGEPDASWLYLKLYCGVVTADRVLRELIAPLAQEQWFFVRYADPFPHLRVRFKGRPDLEGLTSSALLWKVEGGAYVPERSRYPDLALAERLFWRSSERALSVLHLDADSRWRHALSRVDGLLTAAGLSLSQKRTLTRAARDQLSAELGISRDLLSPKFRALRAELETLISEPQARFDFTPDEQPRVRAMVMDLAHMDVNRILQNNPRPQELVIYDFLARLYDSATARSAARE